MKQYDDIIIGGGTAGCVLANRLSENPSRTILLIEAGPDYPDINSLPPDIRSADKPTYSHDWDYVSEPGNHGRTIKLRRAKLTGGCSATNAVIALRGSEEIYNEWETSGNKGWSFEEVLPYFCKLENDIDFDNKFHGKNGPVTITRYKPDELHSSFINVCGKYGFNIIEDHNAPGSSGAGPVPVNAVNGIRQSTSLAYLAQARFRKNLTLKSNSQINQILFEGKKAAAILLAGGEKIYGERMILSSGAYGSPALLMRSGIGPAEHLISKGINVIAEMKGIGNNLIDHPLLGLLYSARAEDNHNSPFAQSVLTLKSSNEIKSCDLQIFPSSVMEAKKELNGTGAFFILFVSVLRPKSRGKLMLRSKNPDDDPIIDMGYFTHPDDMKLMIEGIETARNLSSMKSLSDHIVSEIFPGKDNRSIEDAVIQRVETYHHPVGTCKMGNDDMSVVDSKCKVHGTENLYVVDASIMPDITSANTNLPVIMIAERCCEWLQN